ncbi:MAG: hypothetical protein WCF68_02455 [Terriglobales bacterium]
MVTLKTRLGSFEDSYGMAIPAERLRTFLAGHLRADAGKLPTSPANAGSLKTDDLYKRVAPSVVYIENIQEGEPEEQEE